MRNRLPLALSLLLLLACDTTPPVSTAPPAPPATNTAPAPAAPEVRFITRITGGARDSDTLPLVVAIHGLGATPESLAGLYEGLSAKARLVLPYGLDPYSSGYSWFAPTRASFEPGTRHAADALAAMIERLSKRFPTRGKAVVTGFSQGGILSWALAARRPDLVRAAFPVSGIAVLPLFPASWPEGQPKPTIHAFHGAADARLSIDDDRASVARARALGLSAELSEYPDVGHTVSPAMRRDLLRAIDASLQE
jgi:phospholipase/carboxylesterase